MNTGLVSNNLFLGVNNLIPEYKVSPHFDSKPPTILNVTTIQYNNNGERAKLHKLISKLNIHFDLNPSQFIDTDIIIFLNVNNFCFVFHLVVK